MHELWLDRDTDSLFKNQRQLAGAVLAQPEKLQARDVSVHLIFGTSTGRSFHTKQLTGVEVTKRSSSLGVGALGNHNRTSWFQPLDAYYYCCTGQSKFKADHKNFVQKSDVRCVYGKLTFWEENLC